MTRRCGRLLPALATATTVLLLLVAALPGAAAQRRRRPSPSPKPLGAAAACSRLSKRTACGTTALAFECSSSAAAAPPPACADPRSQPCRVAAGPTPTECPGGLLFSLKDQRVSGVSVPGARLVTPAEATHYITAAVIARGTGGLCSFAAPPHPPVPANNKKAAAAFLFRAPGTAVSAVDLCVCVPTTITFEPVGGPDDRVTGNGNPTGLLKAPVCAPGKSAQRTVPLPRARAVDDCGHELPVTVETSVPGAGSKRPGDAIDLQTVPCGTHTVTYSAVLPAGDLLAVKDFEFEVQCAAAAGGALPVASLDSALAAAGGGVPCI